MERPKIGPKGTQAARVAVGESAEGSPFRGEMSGSERVNIDERDRASQIARMGEQLRQRYSLSVVSVLIREIRG
jgi:hypothetical protein